MSTAPPCESDPRGRSDGLGWVSSALYPDSRVRLHIGMARTAGAVPKGHNRVATYAIAPSASHPRFLVPNSSRLAASRSLLAYNALRPRGVRLARSGLGLIARTGLFGLPPTSVLTVSAPAGLDPADIDLLQHLSRELGVRNLVGACGVRPPDPNQKPTLQLFDIAGRPVGFAKVGWNDATRDLVATEAQALRDLESTTPGHPITPRLILTTQWNDRFVAVVEPLPPQVRGVKRNDPVRVDEALTVARCGGPPGLLQPLGESRFIRRVLKTATSRPVRQDVGDRLAVLVRRFVAQSGTTPIEFGRWHGDWVPWNLGTVDDRLVAWDWEHSGENMPIGSDLVHDAFQRALILDQVDVSLAVRRAQRQLTELAPKLDLAEQQRDAVLVGYLIEMWLRAQRLAAGGAGWNTALHPGLLDQIDLLLREMRSSCMH